MLELGEIRSYNLRDSAINGICELHVLNFRWIDLLEDYGGKVEVNFGESIIFKITNVHRKSKVRPKV